MRRWPAAVLALALALLAAACVPPAQGDANTQPPPAPLGVQARPGGGSGEVVITWTPLPTVANVAFYRVYERKFVGAYWMLAVVTDAYRDTLEPGRLGIVDAPDYWPWPSTYAQGVGTQPRCYVVTAVSKGGLEGPMSAEVCGAPPGGVAP